MNLAFRSHSNVRYYLPESMRGDKGKNLYETTHVMSLIGISPYSSASVSNGSVFGKHPNNRQPDQSWAAVAAQPAGARFFMYGNPPDSSYSFIKDGDYWQIVDSLGANVLSFEVDTNSSLTVGTAVAIFNQNEKD